jgi:interferon gamma-inducible protein 30
MHEMGKKTESLDPAHDYVPWIVLNGLHTDDIQNEASEHLLALVCDTYTGDKPKECHNQTGGFFKWMRDLYSKIVVEIMP